MPNITSTNLTYLKGILDKANPEPNDNSVSFAIITDNSGATRSGGGDNSGGGGTGATSGGVREAAAVMGANALLTLSVIFATTVFF